MEDVIYTQNIDWQPLRAFPGTAEVKMLRKPVHGGARTMLVRLQPGGQIRPHTHMGGVQHYVLEGSYQTRGESYPAGTYRFLAKGAEVHPISTTDGVTMLMIFDPIEHADAGGHAVD
jgi:quercetin dioxygenase-like cupin family protein